MIFGFIRVASILHNDDRITEGYFLLQLLTFNLKNIFYNLLISPFLIHDSNFLLYCLCLLTLVGWDENTVNLLTNQILSFLALHYHYFNNKFTFV